MIPHNELVKSSEFWLENIQDDLYSRVKAYMKKNDINQTELAKELGVSRAYISQIMNGSFNFTLKKLIEISLHIGVFPDLKFIPFESPEINKYSKEEVLSKKLSPKNNIFPNLYEPGSAYQNADEFMENILNESTPQ
jgi:transcriptional regulator with XRE-family HTH domain